MNTVPYDNEPTFLSRLMAWTAKGWECASEMDVIGTLDEDTIRRIAGDCGVSADQLVQLAKAGPHGADEMLAMMRALNIDPVEVELRYRAQFRDMQVNCANCSSKKKCRHDLASGEAPANFDSYCHNADHLNGMRAEPELLLE